MVEEIVSLGFKRMELSHGIRLLLVPGILQAIEEGLIEVSSVHNFCPLPGSVQHAAPNLYEPSASDVRERNLWLRYTQQTMAFAVRVGAQRLVMHSGSVNFFLVSAELQLEKWINAQEELKATDYLENKAYLKRRDRAMRRIRNAAPKAMKRIHSAFLDVLSMAKDLGLQLCIENREGLEEMPIDAYFKFFEYKPGCDLGFVRRFRDCVCAWAGGGQCLLRTALRYRRLHLRGVYKQDGNQGQPDFWRVGCLDRKTSTRGQAEPGRYFCDGGCRPFVSSGGKGNIPTD